MKKVLLTFLFTLMILPVVVKADDNTSAPTSADKIATQKDKIEKYCDQNEQVSGCLYSSSNKIFTESQKIYWAEELHSDRISPLSMTIPAGQKLVRGYQTFDGDGNAIFAGCYKYQKTDNNGPGGAGTYFIFQIVGGKNCKVINYTIIPAEGVKMYSKMGGSAREYGTYNGQSPAGAGNVKMANFNKWVAKENGDCPKVFGYTANASWAAGSEYKYSFSENIDDFNIKTFSFFNNETYVGRPGCTVEDVDGKATAQKLLDGILKEIKGKTCPSKIEDMNSFQSNLESWYEQLRTNNEYRVLWSAGLIDEVTKKSAQEQISAAIHDKISDCQYTICKIDSTKRQTIESNLGSACKNGCTLSNVKTPSDSDKAKCYCCGNSQGCIYQWSEEGGSSCSLQSSIPKGQCIGTSKDLECRKCLSSAYDKAGLTDEQKSCMAGSEIAKLLTESNIEKANDDAATQDVNKEIEANKQTRETVFQKLNQQETKFEFVLPSGNISACKDLLGPNLAAVVKASFLILQIVGAIIAIVKGMMTLIPPILAKDAEALKKAGNVLTKMAIVLVIIFLLRPLLQFLGSILGFDVSCIV